MAAFRNDPFLAYNFLVSFVDSSEGLGSTTVFGIQRSALGGFSEVSGLEMTLEVEEYNEGGRNDTVRKFPTRTQWTNLRLKRGMAFSDDLWRWHYDYVEGRGIRRDLIVALQNDLGRPVRIWYATRCLPLKWTGPSLNAARSEVAVEEVEIAHEGLSLEATGALMGAGELVATSIEVGRSVVGGVRDAVREGQDFFGD